jgi:protein-tyrosine phosphatase
MNILFVCTANISRSFLAEKIFKHKIEQQQISNISVLSAGVHAFPGNSADSKMVDFLNKSNIPHNGHESKLLDDDLMAWADMILVMEKRHREHILSQWPNSEEKVHLMGKFVSPDQPEADVDDPYGLSSFYYRATQSQILLGIDTLIKHLSEYSHR